MSYKALAVTTDNPPSVKIMDIKLERSHVSTYCSAYLAVCYSAPRLCSAVSEARHSRLFCEAWLPATHPRLSRKMLKCRNVTMKTKHVWYPDTRLNDIYIHVREKNRPSCTTRWARSCLPNNAGYTCMYVCQNK